MSKEMRITGPPGTGKTTTLATKIIPMLAEKYGPEKVMVTSFTKAAARELGQRIDANGSSNIGTLHSMCYKALKHPPLTQEHLHDWNHSYLRYSFAEGMKVGPTLFAEYQIYRNKMIPRDKWHKATLRFAEAWEAWKNKNHFMDFIDLIEIAGNQLTPPGSPAAIVVDECQDFTRLEMSVLRRWATQCQEFWICGDANQCQPAGTMVLTTFNHERKEIPIESLNPTVDKLVAHAQLQSSLHVNNGKGYNFDINKRLYTGNLYTITAGDKKTSCTSNHLWKLKWNDSARDLKWNVVYLMQKGSNFRIGWAQLFRKQSGKERYDSFHLSDRARIEKADCLWILKIFDNKQDAAIYESYITAQYGLPLITFKAVRCASAYTQQRIDWLFSKMEYQEQRATQLLKDYNLDIKYPLYIHDSTHAMMTGEQSRLTARQVFKLETINIMKMMETSNFFKIAIHNGKYLHDIKWVELDISYKNVIDLPVYSLNVEKYHTYVADGICSCNCIFSFSGASAENMLKPEIPDDQKIYLEQSYRVPRAVHKTAMKIISRVEVRDITDYNPRDFEGSVTTGIGAFDNPDWLINEVLKRPGTSMIAASCNYMLNDITNELRNRGIPFSNPWRKEAKEWNPLNTIGADLLLSFISTGEDDNYWNTSQFLSWASHLIVGDEGLIRKQGKAGIKQLQKIIDDNPDTPGLHTCREYIEDILSPGVCKVALQRDVRWLQSHVTKKAGRMIQFPARVLSKQGKKALFEEPRIYIGTMHCSPPWEPILTATGYVPISKLDSNIHQVPSYHRQTNSCFWGRNNKKLGYPIIAGNRSYNGDLITIKTTQSKTCITPDHRLIVKFSKNFYNKHVVYLMRRGEWWRIGLCTSGHRPYKSGGIGGRLSTEQADCAWILKVCKNRMDAFCTEQLFQTKYGISGVPFRLSNGCKNPHMTTEQAQFIHESCKHISLKRSKKMLSDLGQSIDYPLWTRHVFNTKHNIPKNPRKKNMHGFFEIRAMNFMDGYMQLPVISKSFVNKEKDPLNRKPLLLLGFSSRKHYEGLVYSLDVKPYHYYISGGAVVHNSFKGTEADNVFLYPDLSFASMKEMETQDGYDNVCRLFYVGVTRAKENLILMPPMTSNHFEI